MTYYQHSSTCMCNDCSYKILDARREVRAALIKAQANFRRARTVHLREQIKGLTDGSVAQTRRMALAVDAMNRAAFKFQDACRACGKRTDYRNGVTV